MADPNQREILVVKKKIAPEVHGGSAWKVAYADFVTAMMAFFLLLWLLNATTEDQKQGISNYFEPVGATSNSTGSGGMLGGISATDPGPIRVPGQTLAKTVTAKSQSTMTDTEKENAGDPAESIKTPQPRELPRNTEEDQQFDAAKTSIRRAMEQVPELNELIDSVAVDVVRDGLRIRLMDSDEQPLFARSGTELNKTGQKLLRLVAEIVERMPNDLQISGHTTPDDESDADGATNWEISISRAVSAQRLLAALGTPEGRFDAVRGSASQMPIDPDKPDFAANRRIEVTLLRRTPEKDQQAQIPPSVIKHRQRR